MHGKEKDMENNKKKFKFNIVDAIVLLVVICAVAFVGIKVLGGGLTGGDTSKYHVEYFLEESPDFAVDIIQIGDKVLDEQKDTDLGKVTAITSDESVSYGVNSNGEYIRTTKPGYKSAIIETEVEAKDYDFGMIAGSAKYGVGHSITIRVGKAKVFGRISKIEKID